MAKYSYEFKHQIVQEYLQGLGGYKYRLLFINLLVTKVYNVRESDNHTLFNSSFMQ